MSTQIKMGVKLNIQSEGAANVQSQIEGMEKELIEAAKTGDNATKNWLKSMIQMAKATKEVVMTLEKIGNAELKFDQSFLTGMQQGIEKAVEQGVIRGMQAGKKAVATGATAGQGGSTSSSSSSVIPLSAGSDATALTASIVRLDQSIVNFATALNRQNALSGNTVRKDLSNSTGRPQFDVFQEISEVSLRDQGNKLRNVASSVVDFLGGAEQAITDKKKEIKKMVLDLTNRIDIKSLSSGDTLLPSDGGESFGSSGADLVGSEILDTIKQKMSVQLLGDTDALFKVLHEGFVKLKDRGYKGQSALQDEQGKWLSQTEAGQRLMATMAARFFQSMPLAQVSPQVRQATENVPSSADGAFDMNKYVESLGDGAGSGEMKEMLAVVTELMMKYEQIEQTQSEINNIEKKGLNNEAGSLQNLERMLALNRDQFALAKQNNSASARYANILQQNQSLLAQAPDAVSYAIQEGDMTSLIGLQREYSHQVQRSTNLHKDLEVQANRQRNLAQSYSTELVKNLTTSIQSYSKLGLSITDVTSKIIAQDKATRASGGSPQFEHVTDSIKQAGASLETLLGNDIGGLIDNMLGGNFNAQMAAQLQEAFVFGVKKAATSPDISNAMSPMLQQLAAGMQQLAQGSIGLEGVSAQESAQLIASADAMKLMADRTVEAAQKQRQFTDAAKETVNKQILLEQQTVAVDKVLKNLSSETRIGEEGLRIIEKQLRKLAAVDFKMKAALVTKDDITGLTRVEEVMERIRGAGGLFDSNAIDQAKNMSRALKDLRDQLDASKFDIEASRQAQTANVQSEAQLARTGGPSEFSGIAPEDLDEEVAKRLKAVNDRFDVMKTKAIEDLKAVETALGQFGSKIDPIVRQGERIQNTFKGIGEQTAKISGLSVQLANLKNLKINDSLDVSIAAGIFKNFGQDVDNVSRKNRELRSEMQQISMEAATLQKGMTGRGTAEQVAQASALKDKYAAMNAELIKAEALEKSMIAAKNSAIHQETILADKRLQNARQMASGAREFDIKDAGFNLQGISKDLKSLNVDVIARASNEFKTLKSSIASALQQAQKSLSTFQSQAKNGGAPLSTDDAASVNMLQERIKQMKELTDQISKQEVAAKSADSRLREQVTTFADYGQNLRQMVKSQVDFAIGTGAITAGFAALGLAFREVISEARAVSRAVTVLQSNLITTAQLTDQTYAATRKLAVQYGMTVGAVADIAKELGSAGFNLQEVSRGWESTLRAINATNADATQVTRAVSGIYAVYRDELKAAGQEAQAFGIITNTLTSIFQNHQAEMDEIVQGYKFVVGTGKVAGFSFQQMGGYLAVLNDNMIKSGMAGRSLQVVFAQMAAKTSEISQAFGIELDPSKTVAEQFNGVLEQMNKRMGDGAVSAGELNKIFKIFDKQGARAFTTLVKQYPAVKKALVELEVGAEGVTAKMNDIINNSLDRKFYQMKQAALDFARVGLDSIKPSLITLLELFKAFFKMINSLNASMGGLGSKAIMFGALTVAIVKVTYALSALALSMAKAFAVSALNVMVSMGTAVNSMTFSTSALVVQTNSLTASTTAFGASVKAAYGPALLGLGKLVAVVALISAAFYGLSVVVDLVSGNEMGSMLSEISDFGKNLWGWIAGAAISAANMTDRMTTSLDKSRAELARLRKEAIDYKGVMTDFPKIVDQMQSGSLATDVGGERIQQAIINAGGAVSTEFSDLLSESAGDFGDRLKNDINFSHNLKMRLESQYQSYITEGLKKQRDEKIKIAEAEGTLMMQKYNKNISEDSPQDVMRNRLAAGLALGNKSMLNASGDIKSVKELQEEIKNLESQIEKIPSSYSRTLATIFGGAKIAKEDIEKDLVGKANAEKLKASIAEAKSYLELQAISEKSGGNLKNELTKNWLDQLEMAKTLIGTLRTAGFTDDALLKSDGMITIVKAMFPEASQSEISDYLKKLVAKTKPVIVQSLQSLNPDPTDLETTMQAAPFDLAKVLNFQGSPGSVEKEYQIAMKVSLELEVERKQLVEQLDSMREKTLEDVIAASRDKPIIVQQSVEYAKTQLQSMSVVTSNLLSSKDTPSAQVDNIKTLFKDIARDAPAAIQYMKEASRIRKELMRDDLSEDEIRALTGDLQRNVNMIYFAQADPESFNAMMQTAIDQGETTGVTLGKTILDKVGESFATGSGQLVSAMFETLGLDAPKFGAKAGDSFVSAFQQSLKVVAGQILPGLNMDTVGVNALNMIKNSKAIGANVGGLSDKDATENMNVKVGEQRLEQEARMQALLDGNVSRVSETNSLLRKQYDLNSLISQRTATIRTGFMKMKASINAVNVETEELKKIKEKINLLDQFSSQEKIKAVQAELAVELAKYKMYSQSQLMNMDPEAEVEGKKVGYILHLIKLEEQLGATRQETASKDADIIKKGREINYQKETELNLFEEKAALMAKEQFFMIEMVGAQDRLNAIHDRKVEGLIREMTINRELVKSGGQATSTIEGLLYLATKTYESKQKELEIASEIVNKSQRHKAEQKIISKYAGIAAVNAAAMNKIIDGTTQKMKNLRTLAQKFAEENTTALETISAAETVLYGTNDKSAKALQARYAILSRLPQLNLNSQQIEETGQTFGSLNAGTAGSAEELSNKRGYESQMIGLLARRIKMIKEIDDATKELTKTIKEQLVQDKRPELYKELAESQKRIMDPLRAESDKRIEDRVNRDPVSAITLSQSMAAQTGDDFYWAMQNNKEMIKEFMMAVEDGRASMEILPQNVRMTMEPQIAAYKEMIKYEKMLMASQVDRAKKASENLVDAIKLGDLSRSNTNFETLQSSVMDMAKKSGNEASTQSMSKQLIDINTMMLDAEKLQNDGLIRELGFANEQLEGIRGLMKKEAEKVVKLQSSMLNIDDTKAAVDNALKGIYTIRSGDIEAYQIDAMEALTKSIFDLQSTIIYFADKLAANNIVNSPVNSLALRVDSPEKIAYEKDKTEKAMERLRANLPYASGDNQDAINKSIEERKASNQALEAVSIQIKKRTDLLLKEAMATSKNIQTVDRYISTLEQGRRVEKERVKIERERGAAIITMYAEMNPIWDLLTSLPDILQKSVSTMFRLFEPLGNLDYAVHNAEQLLNFQRQLVVIGNTYAESIDNTTLSLRRNATEYYDYIGAIQDAERQRGQELMAAQEAYRESLKRTRDVINENFLTPAANSIGGAAREGLGSISESASQLFTDSLNSLVFRSVAGADTSPSGSPIEATDKNTSATDKLTGAFNKAANTLKELPEQMLSSMKAVASKVIQSQASSEVGGNLVQNAQGAVGALLDTNSSQGTASGAGTADIAKSQDPSFFESIMKNAGGILLGVAGTVLTTALSGFASIAGTVFDSVMSGQAGELLEFVKRFAAEIPSAITGIVTEFKTFFPEIIETLVSDVLPAIVDTLATELPGLISTIFDTFISAFPKMITTMVNGLSKAVGPLADALLTGIAELVPTLISTLPEIIGGLQAAVVDVSVSLLKNLPRLIVSALVSVIALTLMPIDIATGLLNSTLGKLFNFKIPSLVKAFSKAGAGLVSKIPTFHTGGVVGGMGEVPAILLGGEGVLNQRAMAMLGKQNLDALNKGYMPNQKGVNSMAQNGMTRNFSKPVSSTTNMGGMTVNITGVKGAEEIPDMLVEAIDRRLVKRQQNRQTKL